MRALLLLLLLSLLLLRGSVGQVQPYCGTTLTSPRIVGCVECNSKKCFYCNYRRSPIWTGTSTSPVLSECRPLSIGSAACRDIDSRCTACERTPAFPVNKCVRCQAQYGAVGGKCLKVVRTLTTENATVILSNCRKASMNPDCIECHQDATCSRCPLTKPFLSPTNAVWLDAGYPETQCTTRTGIATNAKSIAGVDLLAANSLATLCRELDTDFRCASCAIGSSTQQGYGPVKTANPNKIDCQPNDGFVVKDAVTGKRVNSTLAQQIGRNGCYMKRPFMQYCLKCSDDGRKCLATKDGQPYGCTAGRSIDASGACSLNCKGLFGIACKACTSEGCTQLDTAFASGR